ncbi:MAG: PAS domain-containing protein [Clostridium sp.]|nr:PAS domain-containing protein [Clostridium sp.]MCM1171654.1 PAS domain-containing protein [Clostridium sp.]MCM1207802.1 PAS domain-containing protein [Ruminococcus sp.]
MVLENIYLKKALAKVGCVVIVKTCRKQDRKSKLEYISPNASTIGMNVELINKGLKLTEDYIHPEDREKVITTVMGAAKAKVESYVHEHRVVGDDGSIFHVSNDICITEETDESFKIEMYITPVQNKSEAGGNVPEAKLDDFEKIDYSNMGENKILESFIKMFAELAQLYSTFVNLEGKVVVSPVGPATNLGDFYDLFEKPEYKEYYKTIEKSALSKEGPVIMDREKGGLGKICAAPIYVNGEVLGLWILGSYTEKETEKLKNIYKIQWSFAGMIADYMEKDMYSTVEAAKAKGAGVKLREELARQNIINEALSKAGSRLTDSVDMVISEIIRDVGVNMDIEKVMLYLAAKGKPDKYVLNNYWDAGGDVPDRKSKAGILKGIHMVQNELRNGQAHFTIDSTNMTAEYKLGLMHYGIRAIIALPIVMNDEMRGMLLFAECKSERVWTKEELRFSKSIALVIQNMLDNAYGDDNVRNVNKQLIDIYNAFKVGIFVRDAHTGEVLFSNKAMDEMLGYDFKGRDSRELITDLHDRFDNISGMRNPFFTKNKEASWRRYIQKLDAIMDINEIKMEWLNGQPASFIVLRKAKDGQIDD